MTGPELIQKLPEPYRSLAIQEIKSIRALILEVKPEYVEWYDQKFQREYTHVSVLLTEMVAITTSRDFYQPDSGEKYRFWLKVGHAVDSLPPIPDFYK